MFVALKCHEERKVEAQLVKLVLSAWPQFDGARYVTTVCNTALVIEVGRQSPMPLTRLLLLAEKRFFATSKVKPSDISHTLLDGSNPLTYQTQGRYRRQEGTRTLTYYDGLPAVTVDSTARMTVTTAPDWAFVRFEIAFTRPLKQGMSVAVRFWFPAPGMLAAAEDGMLRFDVPVQSEMPVVQFVREEDLDAQAIPILNVGPDNLAGGLDVFIYQSLDYDGAEFNYQPVFRLLPDYDHLGRQGRSARLKFAWVGTWFNPKPATPILVTDRLALRGAFRRRTPRMTPMIHNSRFEGPVIFGDSSGSAFSQNGTAIAVTDSDEALKLLDLLRGAVARAEGDPVHDAIELHVDDIEDLVRRRRFAGARERLQQLAQAAGALTENAIPVLDLVEKLKHVL